MMADNIMAGDHAGPGKPSITDMQIVLGQVCLNNGGRDREQALEWFRSAARSGDPCALNMVGRCHENGWGVSPDPKMAAAYYKKAADLGDVWALFNLADLYCRGFGVPRCDHKAYLLYTEAARKGLVKALNMLGLFHECGRAVPANAGQALDYFKASAEAGDCWGQFNYGRMLTLAGHIDAALPWFRRALDSGFSDFFRSMDVALSGHPDPRLRALARQARALARGGKA